ncbi:MAG: TonB-dependent receptor [Bryobacteraceae bacterium]
MIPRRAVRFAFLFPALLLAQLTTGFVEGTLHATGGAKILITGGAGFRASVVTDASGRFAIALPNGRYEFSLDARPGAAVLVTPHETTSLDLVVDLAGLLHAPPAPLAPTYPEAYSLQGVLLSREPATVTEPLDFTGLADNRLAVESQSGVSWTRARYTLDGMDAADSYQPGRPSILPDVEALEDPTTGSGLVLKEPRESWHGALSTADTGSFLGTTNLPGAADRGLVQQSERFTSFTRDRIEADGPLTSWADLMASAAGQWSAQTVPLAAPGAEQHSRLLFENVRSRIRAGSRDQIEALYSGSSVNLSDWGQPAGFEALAGGRMMPQFPLAGGFAGQSERDRFDFLQVGWTHVLSRGILQVRYGYSDAHLDTTGSGSENSIELLGGAVTGAPPLANLATRTRNDVEGVLAVATARHHIAAGGGSETSAPRNRFTAPSGTDLITAAGAPAFTVEFDMPTDTRERVQSFSGYVSDRFAITPALWLDAGLTADFSRGSVPARSDLIAWNSVAPRAGFAWRVPHSRSLVLGGSFSRTYAPLAGRYLDFGDPNSLGGNVYLYQGPLVARFGGPYSSIDPSLRRPYSDQFDIGARIAPFARLSASIHLFRSDEKQRLAAINVGVPASAFTPVAVLDPYDNQSLTVYQQNPSTFGQDRYLLTNPPGLGEQNSGLVAELADQWRRLTFQLSFVAEKSHGPTNPGDAVFENDPGVVGALFADPNTTINAAGRSFVDRAYVAKAQVVYRLPAGIELASVADYLDGLPFARQLLVTGLAQGPIMVATTVRGSPDGGNRAQYVANWNLRLGREFGRFAAAIDILNVTNAAQRLQESDLSSPAFILRLPVAIQPPRFARLELRYEF